MAGRRIARRSRLRDLAAPLGILTGGLALLTLLYLLGVNAMAEGALQKMVSEPETALELFCAGLGLPWPPPGGETEAIETSAPVHTQESTSETADAPDGAVSTDDLAEEGESFLPEEVAQPGSIPEGGFVFELPGAGKNPVSDITISPLASESYIGTGKVLVQNSSSLTVDVDALLKEKLKLKLGAAPQVLIIHTHGSESYTPEGVTTYDDSTSDRSTDLTQNVVRVGDEIERILKENGIGVIHDRTMYDQPKYSGAYTRSLAGISAAMKKNPSIKVVIDVHRDAMVAKNGTKYKTVCEIDGQKAAQLMFVAGTNGGGLTHDNWKENLKFMLGLQGAMNTKYENIMRPIQVRNERFNQHATLGSMILEVGTSGNSLNEALRSAKAFAGVLAAQLNALK